MSLKKRDQFVMFKMCLIELQFVSDSLKKWFARKYKRRFIKLYSMSKKHSEKENLIDWAKDKCVICNFLLAVGSLFSADSEKLIYYDFVIRKEL